MAGWNWMMRMPQLGTRKVPKPMLAGVVPFMNRVGGAMPGQGASMLGGGLLQQLAPANMGLGGATAFPVSTSGSIPYMNRIGGAIPGQSGSMLGPRERLLRGAIGAGVTVPGPMTALGPYLQQPYVAPDTTPPAATLPTTPAAAIATGAETAPSSPAMVGRDLTIRTARRRSAVPPMLGY